MMKWDSRMHNTRSVQVLKVAIPFFDVSEGELIDVEGLLQAIHPLTCGRERKMMDSVMSFFQMRHMMDLFHMMREVQKANEASGAEGTENPFEMLKMLMPEESQKDFEMISSMMEMMQAASVEQPYVQCGGLHQVLQQGHFGCTEFVEFIQIDQPAGSEFGFGGCRGAEVVTICIVGFQRIGHQQAAERTFP